MHQPCESDAILMAAVNECLAHGCDPVDISMALGKLQFIMLSVVKSVLSDKSDDEPEWASGLEDELRQ